MEKKIFKELKILDKKNNKRWFYECICKFYIAKNLKLKKITIFDEGILQRLSMIIKLNKKKNVLNDLFKLADLSDVILLKDSNIKDLFSLNYPYYYSSFYFGYLKGQHLFLQQHHQFDF